MKQLTEPIGETLHTFNGNNMVFVKTGERLLNKWQCEECSKIYYKKLKICEMCGKE